MKTGGSASGREHRLKTGEQYLFMGYGQRLVRAESMISLDEVRRILSRP